MTNPAPPAPPRRNRDTSAAVRANKIRFARARFGRWAEEMRAWGCTVEIPEILHIPTD